MIGVVLRTAGICGGRVYSSIPKDPTYPLATVIRIGGIPAEKHWLDTASLQIEVWGNNKAEARDAADAARIAIHTAEGTTLPAQGGFISGVQDSLGLTFIPDPTTLRDRYLFGVVVTAHTTLVT